MSHAPILMRSRPTDNAIARSPVEQATHASAVTGLDNIGGHGSRGGGDHCRLSRREMDGPDLLADPKEDRYSRLSLIPWWDQARIAASRILVIGAGALGNGLDFWCAALEVGYCQYFLTWS